MEREEQVFQIVKESLEELNEELQYDTLREIDKSSVIFGGDDGIDSLSLVSLVASLEHEISKAFDAKIVIADEKVMSERNSPFRDVSSLVAFILGKLNGADNV